MLESIDRKVDSVVTSKNELLRSLMGINEDLQRIHVDNLRGHTLTMQKASDILSIVSNSVRDEDKGTEIQAYSFFVLSCAPLRLLSFQLHDSSVLQPFRRIKEIQGNDI